MFSRIWKSRGVGRILTVALLFLLGGLLLVSRSAKADSVTFSGILRDGAGQPETSATINLLQSGNVIANATTAADGSFSIVAEPAAYGLAITEQGDGNSQMVVNSEQGPNPNDAVIDLSQGNVTQDLSLPALAQLNVTATDALAVPIANAQVSSTRPEGQLSLWPDGPLLDVARQAVGSSSFGTCQTDGNGQCGLGTFIGAGEAAITLNGPINTSTQATAPVIATDPASVSLQLNNYVVLTSAGSQTGNMTAITPNGTTMTDISTSALPGGNTMPSGATILTGVIAYKVSSVTPGATINEGFLNPPDGATTVYSYSGGNFTDITSASSFYGYLTSVNVTDGGTGDNDGAANGIIDQALVFVRNVTPTAPSTPVAISGNGSAFVAWTAPTKTGGADITGYVVTPYKNGVAQSSTTLNNTTTAQNVTGLTNGQTYTFAVAAKNSMGTGAKSAQSAPVVINIPQSPGGVKAIPGNKTATVSWTVPPGGPAPPAVTGYVVTPYVGNAAQPAITFNSTATTQTITNLANGTNYTFKVAAKSATGTGSQSAASSAVTVGTPIAPTNVSATTGNAQASVSWSVPSNNNGSAVTGYVITPYLNGVAQPVRVYNNVTTSQTVTGLTNGQTYTFSVAAKNSMGTGPQSTQSAAITIGVPTAPAITSAVPLNTSAIVTWTPSTNNNGAAVTNYVVTPFIGGQPQTAITYNAALTTQVVGGLLAGQSYTFKVAAKNANGTGAQSPASNSVTPLGTTTEWKDLNTWTHAWDAKDAVLYTPTDTDQTNYGITADQRVESIPDTGVNNLPLMRDQGAYSAPYGLPTFVPGPQYINSSSFFGGRPALHFDALPNFSNFYSMLSPNKDFTDPSTWFNPPNGYTAPYWVAIFGDGQDATLGHDGTGPTFGTTIFGNPVWTVAAWNLNFPIKFITTNHPINANDTVLLLYYNSGNENNNTSFLEVTSRNPDGSLRTTRKYGNQNNYAFKEMFLGWVDDHRYWSASGIKLGTPNEGELTNIRNWATSFMPPGGQGG